MEKELSFVSATDYAVLHEISSFGLHDDVESVANEAMDKATRLFRARCFAIILTRDSNHQVIINWGLKGEKEVLEKTNHPEPNRFIHEFSEGGHLFMEFPFAFDAREKRFYTIFASGVEATLERAIAATRQKREEELRRHREYILAALATEKPLREILELIARSLESEEPDAMVSILLLDKEGKKLINGASPSLPADFIRAINGLKVKNGNGACGTAACTGKRVVTEDIQTESSWEEYRDIAHIAGLRACCSEPVYSASGQLLATLAVYYPYPKAPQEINEKRLKTLANLTSITIERKRAEEQLHQSLKEKEILLQEVHHRVKNNLALISGFLELQSGVTDNPEFVEAARESQSRIRSMALVHDQLHQVEYLTSFRFDHYVTRLVEDIASTFSDPQKQIEFELDIHPLNISIEEAIHCGLLLNELLTNAYKHAFTDRNKGLIELSVREKDNLVELTIRDNGNGVPDNFLEINSGSLGVRIILNLIRQLDANISIENSGGSKFVISFPYRL